MKKFLLGMMIAVMYVLHQDFWNWNNGSLVFGFLPAGLAYHAGYSLLACAMMAILVECAWPKHLEDTQPLDQGKKPEDKSK